MPSVPPVFAETDVLFQARDILGARAMRVVGRHSIGDFFEGSESGLATTAHEFHDPSGAVCFHPGRDVHEDECGSQFVSGLCDREQG